MKRRWKDYWKVVAVTVAIAAFGMILDAGALRAGTASGDLDQTYGTNGFDDLGTSSSSQQSVLQGIAAQGYDSSVDRSALRVFVGSRNNPNEVVVGRLLGDGTLDTTFGTDGLTVFNGFINGRDCVAVDGSDRIYVAAGSVVRLLPDGEIDTSFGNGGFADSSDVGAIGLALDASGGVVAVGSATQKDAQTWGACRFDSDGNLDTSFGKHGAWIASLSGHSTASPPETVAIDSNGRIVIGGPNETPSSIDRLIRLNSDGTLDTSFGVASSTATASTTKSAKPSGKGGGKGGGGGGSGGGGSTGGIVVPSFGVQMFLIRDLVAGSNGDFYVSGTADIGTSSSPDLEPVVVHYDTDGIVDTGFGQGTGSLAGLAYPGASGEQGGFSLVISGGKLVQSGYTDDGTTSGINFEVWRYDLSDGLLDTSFGPNSDGASENVDNGEQERATNLTIDASGNILAIGFAYSTSTFHMLLARYLW